MNAVFEITSLDLRPLQEGGSGGSVALVVTERDLSLADVIEADRSGFHELVRDRHAVLFRGFRGMDAASLGRVVQAWGGKTLDYRSGVSPRKKVEADVYTSTELSHELRLPLHNELSYAARWPRTIFFTCLEPAVEGGETPIADVRSVYRSVDEEICSDFEDRGVVYLQNYGTEESYVNVSWQQAFDTGDRDTVEEFCRDAGIELEWLSDGGLRTRKWTPATRVHPVTSESLWFNQAHLFHSSSLDARVRRGMLARLGPEGLPRNAMYGDGGLVSSEVMMQIHRAFDANTLLFDWQRDDVLVLDNMIYAHGRMPFSGSRRVLVAMSDPIGEQQLGTATR